MTLRNALLWLSTLSIVNAGTLTAMNGLSLLATEALREKQITCLTEEAWREERITLYFLSQVESIKEITYPDAHHCLGWLKIVRERMKAADVLSGSERAAATFAEFPDKILKGIALTTVEHLPSYSHLKSVCQ